MNKAVIIGGSVVLLGVGAYVYFKTKSKAETDSATTGTETTGAGTTGAGTSGAGTSGAGTSGAGTSGAGTSGAVAGTTLATPEEVKVELEKIKKAKDLALSICRLRAREKNSSPARATGGFSASFSQTQQNAMNAGIRSAIARDVKKLKLLGYTEVNCEIIKIA
jgi:hypothetical protein